MIESGREGLGQMAERERKSRTEKRRENEKG